MAIIRSSRKSIKVTPKLYTLLDDDNIKLQLGQYLMTPALLVDKSINTSSILVSSSLLMKNLSISHNVYPAFHKLNYRLLPEKIIKAGPVVGVLMARKNRGEYPLPVAREARIYQEMSLQAAKKNIFLYLFYADGVDWKRQIINGHIYLSHAPRKGKWFRASFCLPDIVYNRISYRSKEDTKVVQEFMQNARKSSIYIFNSRFLNKWEVHQCLVNDPLTRHFVLETDAYSKDNLDKYLKKYKEFFIKPVASSLGKGIIKIISSQPNAIEYFRLGKSSGWQTCHSKGKLYNRLGIVEGGKYILQKGINLASIGNRIFDIRAQIQKNGQGNWQFTGSAVRLAAAGKFVTHVPNGGSKRDYHLTLNQVFGHSSHITTGLDRQLKTICQVVPRVLEERLGINLAVLSLDIGIDQAGQMWIIEVNSKPASFDEDPIRQRHLDLLTDYFMHKSNFGVQ